MRWGWEGKCFRCKEPFAMTEATYQTLVRSGANFHCPFGHPQHFTEEPTEADILRRERDRLKQDAARKDENIEFLQRSVFKLKEEAAAAKLDTVRARKRALMGTCPCCHRTFRQMALHMRNKHPEFKAEEATA